MNAASSVGASTRIELAAPRVINPWFVALAVVIPTFMEVLDTTIANVALRHIAGGLSAPVTDGEWVITSYLAANAIVLPISGWLSVRLGRRNYFLLSIAVFTFASALCGMATSLNMLIASRVLQGLAGGGLQPSSQGVLLDAFPRERQGTAMTVFGVAALLAPVVGPTLGGYITDNYGWRWIFYLNVPVGLLALVMCRAVVTDPAYLKVEHDKMRTQRSRFDTLGLCLLSITMVCWEIVLSKGQEWDWLGDPFFRVQTLLILFVFLSRRPHLSRTADRPSPDKFSHAARPKFSLLLHHHFLRLRCALRQHHLSSRFAAIALWLRCDNLGPCPLTLGNLRDHRALDRRRAPLARESMRAISWPLGCSSSRSEATGCRG